MLKKIQDTIIDIDGYKFQTEDQLYQVTSKYDGDAPDGLKEHRTTKILNDSSAIDTIAVVFDDSMQVWDTGLYPESPMYRGWDKNKLESHIEKVQKLVVEPFEKAFGEGRLDHRDPDSRFWNRVDTSSFKLDLFKGRVFDTKRADEKLKLFIALSYKALAPRDKEDFPQYRNANFCIENKDEVRSVEEEKRMISLKTQGEFYKLMEDKTKLKYVLNYVGLKGMGAKGLQDSTIVGQFNRFIEDKKNSYTNKKSFLEAVSKVKSPKGYKELGYYMEVDKLLKKGVITKEGEYFMLKDAQLGTTLKESVAKIVQKKELETALLKEME